MYAASCRDLLVQPALDQRLTPSNLPSMIALPVNPVDWSSLSAVFFDGSRFIRASIASLRSGVTIRRNAISERDRKSTRLNSSHTVISYAVFCLKKKKKKLQTIYK